MSDILTLWLRSEELGGIERLRNGRLRLRYSDRALSTYGEGSSPLSPGDTFALLRVVGRECAGAIQLTERGDVPGQGRLRELSDDEAAAIVSNLPTIDPPDGLPVGASLGGVQAKVLLTRKPMPDGRGPRRGRRQPTS